MKVYAQPKGAGKTIAAIKEAEMTNGYIVCFSRVECARVWDVANKMGAKIRMPITWDEFLHGHGAHPDLQYHIDNLDMCIRMMTRKRIASVYLTSDEE